MIVGIGTDIIEIQRVERVIGKTPRFYETVFTNDEKSYYISKGKKIQHLAGAFASKEAVSKALGTGFREFSASDIEVIHDELGKPQVQLYGEAKKLSDELGVTNIHITISHCQTYAVAYAVIEGGNSR